MLPRLEVEDWGMRCLKFAPNGSGVRFLAVKMGPTWDVFCSNFEYCTCGGVAARPTLTVSFLAWCGSWARLLFPHLGIVVDSTGYISDAFEMDLKILVLKKPDSGNMWQT